MRRSAAVLLGLATVAAASLGSADAGDEVAVSVGGSSLSVAEVQRRLKAVPGFQLATMGTSADQIRKSFAEKVLVPELLFYEEAKRRGVEKGPQVSDRVRDVLRQAVEAELRDSMSSVTPEEIKAYYDANRHRFNTPRRIKLWRILLKSEEQAKKLIADMKRADAKAVTEWTLRARTESVDKPTAMRDGDLGFVTPDGQTEMPQLRVDPALFAAAEKVKDGEIVPQPVKEGDGGFAVVWRRGSLEAVTRTVEQETASIRTILARQKVSDSVDELVKKLRSDKVKGVSAELLSYVTVDPAGDIGTRQKPGVIPRHRARGAPAPRPGERGQR